MTPSARRSTVADTSEGAVVRTVLPGQEVTDGELVERARGGNRWAEEVLFRRHSTFIVGLCTRLLRHRSEADDVVQDAFVSAFERLGQLQEPSQFRNWLASIAVRQVHRRLRRRKFQKLFRLAASDQEDPAASMASMALTPDWMTELAKLDDALRRLEDTYRVAWQLRYVEGYRVEEVAELCHCSLATVKRRIARTHAHIRKYVRTAEVGHD